ncbi:MAG: nitroreductase family protein [Deltaproteobacteria bacterium]|jgi:nitroreductase|nr:nitroreductase family protein [Deltaproteobacteria bacterium]
MDLLQLASEARTCRRFVQDARIGQDDLHWLMECVRCAPCGRNAQVLRYVLVGSPEKCADLFVHLRWAGALKDWDGPAEGERPTAYIAVLTPKEPTAVMHMDVGIAAQTIQLAAHTRGIGCCMHASFVRPACMELLQAPGDMHIALILALGMAREERRLASMPAGGDFAYWRDAQGVHYVPKRTAAALTLAWL